MTAYIKKEPSELTIVLNKIKIMKDNEKSDACKKKLPPHLNPETNKKYKQEKNVTSKTVLEYVCWLAEANKIYDIALGTYDLELVALAA